MKRMIDIDSLKIVRSVEFVPGRLDIREEVIDGKTVRIVGRAITPVFELGSTNDVNARRLSYKFLPATVKCWVCGWEGLDTELACDDNGEEEYLYPDEEGCDEENEDYEASDQVCPKCHKWYCIDGNKDIAIPEETLEELQERIVSDVDIREIAKYENAEEILKLIKELSF